VGGDLEGGGSGGEVEGGFHWRRGGDQQRGRGGTAKCGEKGGGGQERGKRGAATRVSLREKTNDASDDF
jgi:hypothetical protein